MATAIGMMIGTMMMQTKKISTMKPEKWCIRHEGRSGGVSPGSASESTPVFPLMASCYHQNSSQCRRNQFSDEVYEKSIRMSRKSTKIIATMDKASLSVRNSMWDVAQFNSKETRIPECKIAENCDKGHLGGGILRSNSPHAGGNPSEITKNRPVEADRTREIARKVESNRSPDSPSPRPVSGIQEPGRPSLNDVPGKPVPHRHSSAIESGPRRSGSGGSIGSNADRDEWEKADKELDEWLEKQRREKEEREKAAEKAKRLKEAADADEIKKIEEEKLRKAWRTVMPPKPK